MTDFRALCAELVRYLQNRKNYKPGWWPGEDLEQAPLDRAHTALTQLEPQGPEGGHIDRATVIECETCKGLGTINERLGGYAFSNPAAKCPDCGGLGELSIAIQPEPQGPTDEEAVALYSEIMVYYECQTLGDMAGHFARAALARWGRPAIKPVPVSVAERLPEPKDCDAKGCCWVASEDCPAWHRVSRHFDAWHYWLPHHALPVPQQEAKQ